MPDPTPLQLAKELLEAAEKATPRPWEHDHAAIPWKARQRSPFIDQGATISSGAGKESVVVGGCQDEQGGAVGVLLNEDAAYIVTACNNAPAIARALVASEELIGRLVKGLEPFARQAKDIDGKCEAGHEPFHDQFKLFRFHGKLTEICLGDCRRAAALVAEAKQEKP
jgi:hypothetical protein